MTGAGKVKARRAPISRSPSAKSGKAMAAAARLASKRKWPAGMHAALYFARKRRRPPVS